MHTTGHLLSQLQSAINPSTRYVATIHAKITDASFAATTPQGAEVVLSGNASVGDAVYFDAGRRIIGHAPNVPFLRFGV